MVDTASGGAFMNNTLANAKKLIIDMAENAQQFGTRRDVSHKVNEATVSTTDQYSCIKSHKANFNKTSRNNLRFAASVQ